MTNKKQDIQTGSEVKQLATQAEQITEEFFKKRFPDKDIEFEVGCGYFGEWVNRFKSEDPTAFMDEESLAVWKEMQKGGFK